MVLLDNQPRDRATAVDEMRQEASMANERGQRQSGTRGNESGDKRWLTRRQTRGDDSFGGGRERRWWRQTKGVI